MRRRIIQILALAVAGPTSCYGADEGDVVLATDTDTTGTGPTSATSGPDPTTVTSTSSAVDDTSATTADPTDGSCMPGVFGQSQFGAACFQ